MATIFPTIHLNGTSADDLQRQYEEAYRAVNDAIRVLVRSAPHARDYYVQDGVAVSPDIRSTAYAHAVAEHDARVYALTRVRDDLLMIYDAIERQTRRKVSEVR